MWLKLWLCKVGTFAWLDKELVKIQRERSRLERERSKFAEREARSTLWSSWSWWQWWCYRDDYNDVHNQTDCNKRGTATAKSPKRDHSEDCSWQGVQVRYQRCHHHQHGDDHDHQLTLLQKFKWHRSWNHCPPKDLGRQKGFFLNILFLISSFLPRLVKYAIKRSCVIFTKKLRNFDPHLPTFKTKTKWTASQTEIISSVVIFDQLWVDIGDNDMLIRFEGINHTFTKKLYEWENRWL